MTLAPVIPASEVKAIPLQEGPSAFGLGERLLEARRAALSLLNGDER